MKSEANIKPYTIRFQDNDGNILTWTVMGESLQDVERRFKGGEYIDEGDEIPAGRESEYFATCRVLWISNEL